MERSSLVLCGKAFADSNSVKDALAALAAPVLSARGGVPLSARFNLLNFPPCGFFHISPAKSSNDMLIPLKSELSSVFVNPLRV